MLAGCHSRSSGFETQSLTSKVQLDVSSLDDDGLRGPPHGKVAVAYEFATVGSASTYVDKIFECHLK